MKHPYSQMPLVSEAFRASQLISNAEETSTVANDAEGTHTFLTNISTQVTTQHSKHGSEACPTHAACEKKPALRDVSWLMACCQAGKDLANAWLGPLVLKGVFCIQLSSITREFLGWSCNKKTVGQGSAQANASTCISNHLTSVPFGKQPPATCKTADAIWRKLPVLQVGPCAYMHTSRGMLLP